MGNFDFLLIAFWLVFALIIFWVVDKLNEKTVEEEIKWKKKKK